VSARVGRQVHGTTPLRSPRRCGNRTLF
jgi:hypothetical protein